MHTQFEELSKREFLLTNGLGGYASSTFSGANTRRYHGLLVASFNPPTVRKVLVSKVEETITINENSFELSSNRYPNNIHPTGFKLIKDIQATPEQFLVTFQLEDALIQKKISTIRGRNTTVVEYTNLSSVPAAIAIRPFMVFRDFHAMFHKSDDFDFYINEISNQVLEIFAQYGAAPVYFISDRGSWKKDNYWYEHFQYTIEEERGFDFEEDAMQVAELHHTLNPNETIQLIFTTEKPEECTIPLHHLAFNKIDHQELPVFINHLEKSGQQFLVHRQSTNSATVLAGYHWFSDWGRDTMIAMRGLTIATGNQQISKSILQTFFKSIDQGMLPNRFPDYEGEALEYNTIDASLWLFVTLYDYHQKFNDNEFIKEHLNDLRQMLDWHLKGTRYNIKVDSDGLIIGGKEGVQLTWMDAKVEGYVVTPRIGKPVEINLLWYNALKIFQLFCLNCEEDAGIDIASQLSAFEQSFVAKFMNEEGYLADVLESDDQQDNSIRPNMVYALSLPFTPLAAEHQLKMIEIINHRLYTSFGLRTLDPRHPSFRPSYRGDAYNRDTAYHQGTVWPFLWGEWALAHLKLHSFSKEACAFVWQQSAGLRHHFYEEGCAHAIAEIYDGLDPSIGKGCIQQAWSIGNLLMVFLHPQFKWDDISKA